MESASYSQTQALNWGSGINEQGLTGSTWHLFIQIKACLSMHRQGSRKLCVMGACLSVCARASVRVCPRTGTYPKKLVQWCRIHLTRITKDQWSKLNHISLRIFNFLRGPIKTNKHTNKQKPLFTVQPWKSTGHGRNAKWKRGGLERFSCYTRHRHNTVLLLLLLWLHQQSYQKTSCEIFTDFET